ncbi:hypothetical protein VCSRO110_0841 [Vibrio cholerae]|nr:hypothetical protein VCSRO110_0841 [Vibrio cholerae]
MGQKFVVMSIYLVVGVMGILFGRIKKPPSRRLLISHFF